MKQLIEYEMENGNTILIEVDLPEAGIERAGRCDQIIKAKERFGDALEQIQPVAQTVFSKLGNLNADEIGVDFGIKLGAKAGTIIACADAEANFTVKLMWKRGQVPSSYPTQYPPTDTSLSSG